MAERSIDFKITAQDAASRILDQINGKVKGLELGLTKLQAAAGAVAGSVFLSQLYESTVQAERAQARLAAVLQSTAYAAGLSKNEIMALANSLSDATAFDDDEILGGINSLLQFRQVTGDTFKEAAELATDLAVALDVDLRTAFTTLGKALTDPEHGLRGLKAAGMALNEEQVVMVKRLLETGDTAKAQRIVLDELAKSVGGAAAGENQGLYGSSKATAKAWDDFLKALGQTKPVQATAQSFFGFLTQSLKDLEHIINNGDWVEKLLAIMAFGAGGRNFNLINGARPTGVSGQIRNGPISPSQYGGMSESEYRLQQLQQQLAYYKGRQKGTGTDAEQQAINRLLQEGTKGWIAYADAVLAADEAMLTALGSGDSMQVQMERLKKQVEEAFDPQPFARFEEALQNIKLLLDTGFISADRAAELEQKVRDAWVDAAMEAIDKNRELQKETEKADNFARDLGLTFTSAFEDAIAGGKGLSDILKGLEKDLLRLATRKMITEPMGEYFTGRLKQFMPSGGMEGWIGRLFSGPGTADMAAAAPNSGWAEGALLGSFATGTDYVPKTGPYLLHEGERVVTKNENAGGSGGITVHMTINTPDVGGFRQSRAQIAADMQGVLARARRNL